LLFLDSYFPMLLESRPRRIMRTAFSVCFL